MTKKTPQKIIIEGKTKEGKQFRPSDWAERMSGSMATFLKNRIHYSPLLQPTVNTEGYKCVVLDPALKETNPELYESILEFARINNLTICKEEEPSDSDEKK